MASTSQDDLWRSIGENNFGQYFRISEAINISSSRQERRRQNIPLRVFVKRGRGMLCTSLAPCRQGFLRVVLVNCHGSISRGESVSDRSNASA